MLIERILAGEEDGEFGVRLTPDSAAVTSAAVDQRRAAYMQTEDGQLLESLTQQYASGPAPAPSSWPLTPPDLRGVEALLEDVVNRQARLSREEAS